MRKLWLLAVPVMMTLVLAGCEKPLGKHEVKGPNGKIYDKREWRVYNPMYSDKNGVRRCYLMKDAVYLEAIGKPVPKEEQGYLYTPVPPNCLIPASETPVFKSLAEESKATMGK